MRKYLTLIFCVLITWITQAQSTTDPSKVTTSGKPEKFHIGLAYSYVNTDLTLTYMNLQSRIADTDLEENTLTGDEIDDLNSFMKWNEKTQNLYIVFGMFLLKKPDHRWQIKANIFAGLSKLRYEIQDTRSDTAHLVSFSSFQKPSLGLQIGVKYVVNQNWAVVLEPWIAYSWGKLTSINDDLNTELDFATESREHDFQCIYSRINIMAAYTLKRFSFSLGPGLYYIYFTNRYRITRENTQTGFTTRDEIRSRLRSKFPLDGVASVAWRIIDPLTFRIECAVGSDFLIQPGLYFNF
ncbi:MAG TPA: hypothetical protein PKN44_06815 [Bacteroidales bacterium]|nr:hypothetical protein [Bacteroidales bacterium]HPS50867.1 hypothetical protein [Bacteroidales bacterium]